MSFDLIIWMVGAGLACMFLLKMMRSKQAEKSRVLSEYVQEKLAWAKKRSKALSFARKTAKEAAAREKAALALLSNQLNANPVDEPQTAQAAEV